MKTTRVSINGGASAVSIGATIPAKAASVVEDSAVPTEVLLVQLLQSDGTFSAEVQFAPGNPIRVHRASSILARPVGYSASNVPASAEAYMKVRTQSGNTVSVRVEEYEQVPPGFAE